MVNSDDIFQGYSALVSWSKSLSGLECWAVAAGGCVGSQFTLDFGNKIERSQIVNNQSMSDLQQRYEGEFSLFVEGASWRLETETSVVTSSDDDSSPDGSLVRGLETIIGLKVESCEVTLPAMDLILKLSGKHLALKVFCDQVTECSNYTAFGPEFYISIEARSRMIVEYL